jgi:hypothetical protein
MPIRDQIQYRLVLQYSVPKIQYFYSLYSILADKKSNLRSLNSQLSSKEDFFSALAHYNELTSIFLIGSVHLFAIITSSSQFFFLLSQAQFLSNIIMSLRQFFITSPVNLFDKKPDGLSSDIFYSLYSLI